MIARMTFILLGIGSISLPISRAVAQPRPATACDLFTVAEIRRIMGQQGYSNKPDPSDPSDGVVGGGTGCRYEADFMTPPPTPPVVNLVLIRGKGYTQSQRKMKLPPGCSVQNVSGVGDDAFFWHCSQPRQYQSPLYVRKGTSDIVVDIDVRPPLTDASMRPKLVALAKAAAAKVR